MKTVCQASTAVARIIFHFSRLKFREARNYLKNADYVQEQEAHLNQYNQMCYPAYAGARADPPSLKKLWRDRRKSQREVPKMNFIRQGTVANKVRSV